MGNALVGEEKFEGAKLRRVGRKLFPMQPAVALARSRMVLPPWAGRLTHAKASVIVAPGHDGADMGRMRLRRINYPSSATLRGFIAETVERGDLVRTDGLPAHLGLPGYKHDRRVQRRAAEGEHRCRECIG